MSTPVSNGDALWQSWSEAWRTSAESLDLATLRRRARRERRRLLLLAAIEGALLLALLALTVWLLARGARTWELVWLATLWACALVAVGFALWNRRATWRAAGDSVEHYLQLSRLRCERQLRTIRFVLALFVAEVVVVVGQLLWFDRLVPLAVAALGAAAALVASWCLVTARRLRRERERLDAFARELGEADG